MRCVTLLLCLCLSSVSAFAAETIRLSEVSSAMHASPASLPERYFDCSKYKGTVYEAIATGDAQWLSLAVRAVEVSDGCAGERLLDAMGEAMWRHPEAVLPLVGTSARLSAHNICLPFISDELPLTEQLRRMRRSRRAIERALDFPDQKAACLNFIERVERMPTKHH